MSNWLSLLFQSSSSSSTALSPAPPPPSSNPPDEEKRTCRMFLRGKCALGDRCRHSHDMNGDRFLGPGPVLRCHICNSDLSSLDESDVLIHVLDCCAAERHGAAVPDDHDPFAVDCPYPGCGSRLEARNLPLHVRAYHGSAGGSLQCPVCSLLSLHVGMLHQNLLQHLASEHNDLLPTAAYSQALEKSAAASCAEPDQPPPLKTRTLGVVNTRFNVSYIGTMWLAHLALLPPPSHNCVCPRCRVRSHRAVRAGVLHLPGHI